MIRVSAGLRLLVILVSLSSVSCYVFASDKSAMHDYARAFYENDCASRYSDPRYSEACAYTGYALFSGVAAHVDHHGRVKSFMPIHACIELTKGLPTGRMGNQVLMVPCAEALLESEVKP